MAPKSHKIKIKRFLTERDFWKIRPETSRKSGPCSDRMAWPACWWLSGKDMVDATPTGPFQGYLSGVSWQCWLSQGEGFQYLRRFYSCHLSLILWPHPFKSSHDSVKNISRNFPEIRDQFWAADDYDHEIRNHQIKMKVFWHPFWEESCSNAP